MSTHKVRVELHWLTHEEGGRRSPPPGPTFLIPMRLTREPSANPVWSVRLDDIAYSPNGLDAKAILSFVFEDAPVDWLKRGTKFYLAEGRRAVAEGVVQEAVVPAMTSHSG